MTNNLNGNLKKWHLILTTFILIIAYAIGIGINIGVTKTKLDYFEKRIIALEAENKKDIEWAMTVSGELSALNATLVSINQRLDRMEIKLDKE